jgi:hypothetical protein
MSSLTALAAADDPFVGTWKVNWGKSWRGGQTAEFKDLGDNRYEWVRSRVYEYIADGKEHPFNGGNTYSFGRDSANRWVRTLKHDGQVTSVTVWTLSDDGKRMKLEGKATHPDGTPYTWDQMYIRIGAGSGLLGKWEMQNYQVSSMSDWVIKPYGNDGLSFLWPADKEHQEIKFDGKDYPDYGPEITPGTTSCAKRIDEHTIQVTDKLNGKVTSTHELTVSQDGMTLTDTRHVPGQKQPGIQVFEKEM